jgi:tetratricopeptide (TPR) repeat protein
LPACKLLVNERYATDIRRDIELEWSGGSASTGVKKTATVSAANFYQRTPANQSLFDKAQEAIKKNDHKQAASLLNQVVSADAKDYPAWTELGTVYFKQEKGGDAEKAFRRALAEKPAFMLALLNLGKLLFSQKNFDAAIETLTKAVEVDPRSAEANYFLGEAYLQIKKGSKAVGYLNEALRLDPVGKAEAHLRLAALYRGAGMKDKAVAEYEQFLAKKPDHPEKQKIQQYIAENKKP